MALRGQPMRDERNGPRPWEGRGETRHRHTLSPADSRAGGRRWRPHWVPRAQPILTLTFCIRPMPSRGNPVSLPGLRSWVIHSDTTEGSTLKKRRLRTLPMSLPRVPSGPLRQEPSVPAHPAALSSICAERDTETRDGGRRCPKERGVRDTAVPSFWFWSPLRPHSPLPGSLEGRKEAEGLVYCLD